MQIIIVGQDSLNGTVVGRSPAVMIEQHLKFDHLRLKIAIETIELCGAKLAAMSKRIHDLPTGFPSVALIVSGDRISGETWDGIQHLECCLDVILQGSPAIDNRWVLEVRRRDSAFAHPFE